MGKLRPRKTDRVRALSEVTYRVDSTGPALRGHTIDLSPTGVRLFCARSPAVGDAIDLTWADRGPGLTIGGRVVYVNVGVEGNWAGVEFHRPLDPAVFAALSGARRAKARG
jgi:hypothetical protein